jgi:hypothetical protein
MGQISWPKIDDLRALRTVFLEKKLAYALSYSYESTCVDIRRNASFADPDLARTLLDASVLFPARGLFGDAHHVFNVLGATRVPGLDGSGRDVPVNFSIEGHQEDVVLRVSRDSKGHLEIGAGSVASGRMVLVAPAKGDRLDGEPAKIGVTYDGVVRLEDPIALGQIGEINDVGNHALRARAYVTLFFETTHPKYHWLTENAFIAFGTWEFDNRTSRMKSSFDVYAAA